MSYFNENINIFYVSICGTQLLAICEIKRLKCWTFTKF